MLTMGAPASSTAARHSSTVSFSLMVCEYSRMRPQPVQVRLQACSGSSISTSGNRGVPDSLCRGMWLAMELVSVRGKRMALVLCLVPGVARQCHQGEIEPIQVVLQVEDPREAGAGERLLLPVAVGGLGGDEVVDAA